MAKRHLLSVGLLVYAALFIMALLFYKERILFLDGSYYLFFLIKDGAFVIQNYRFIAFFTELLPLMGLKMHASLSLITQLYSISFCLLSAIAFGICLLVLKNRAMALGILLFNTLMVSHTFYWLLSELLQLVPFAFVYLALLEKQIKEGTLSPIGQSVSFLLLFICVFAHPLVLFLFAFVYLFLFLGNRKKAALLTAHALTFLALYAIKTLFFKSNYDVQAMSGMGNLLKLLPDYFSLKSTRKLFHYLLEDYYFVVLLWFLVISFYLKNKDFWKAALVAVSFLGYSYIVNVNNPDGGEQFYMENQYILLSMFVILPFVMEVLPLLLSNYKTAYVYGGVLLIVVFGLGRIYATHKPYSKRLDWSRQFLKRTASLPQKKLIIPHDKVPMDTLGMTWGTSFECCLLSSMEEGVTRSLIIEDAEGQFDWALPGNKAFISRWESFPYASLPQEYFHFSDTSCYARY